MSEEQSEMTVEMLDEYDFSRGAVGKYAKQCDEVTNVVALDPDAAKVFPDSEAVAKDLVVTAHTVCQSCGANSETDYVLLGAPVECPSCGVRNVARLAPGAGRPATRYELTCADFLRLLSDPYCRPSVAPLLRGWFGHELESTGDAARVRSRDGGDVDTVALHLAIQGDEEKQSALYRAAMTLWR